MLPAPVLVQEIFSGMISDKKVWDGPSARRLVLYLPLLVVPRISSPIHVIWRKEATLRCVDTAGV